MPAVCLSSLTTCTYLCTHSCFIICTDLCNHHCPHCSHRESFCHQNCLAFSWWNIVCSCSCGSRRPECFQLSGSAPILLRVVSSLTSNQHCTSLLFLMFQKF
uniref:Uncharacterized protein n=1 Tax=Mus musculus TaxID=10090 RepID=Q8C3R3_MOUSE|nr:unnamed protein product [Mus musculus]